MREFPRGVTMGINRRGPFGDLTSGRLSSPWAFLAVATALAGSSVSGAVVRWPPLPMPFPPRARLQQQQSLGLASAQLAGADVTPEDYVIDQLAAYLQQTQRAHAQNIGQGVRQQLPPPIQEEEDPYDVEFVEESAPSVPKGMQSREGQGLGFTYQFPEQKDTSAFAINPSDPNYYRASSSGRSGKVPDWRSTGELKGSEGGGSAERMRPIERFPPINMAGTESPPARDVEEVLKAASAANGDHVRMSAASHETEDVVPHHRTAGGSSVPAEQVKREKMDNVLLNLGSSAYLTAIISGCTAATAVGVIAFAIFWCRLQRNAKAAADVEYPAYGVTGPNQEASAVAASTTPTPHTGGSTSPMSASGDRRLAQSAQMYHYQHQKQQIIAMESRASNERRGSVSEVDSEEENEEGDYTVYECPGLAPTGEMEVKNPLFHDDPTPATPASGGSTRDQRVEGGKP